MMDRPIFNQVITSGKTVPLRRGVDKDSPNRESSSGCHPKTRKRLTTQIEEWLMNELRSSDLLWLYGAPGVGKSAVAQTIADHADGCKRLGAAFFFLAFNGQRDYQKFWITIAYQLAVHIPKYQQLVAKEIEADPDILHKAPRTQFAKLIVGPLSSLRLAQKFLIIIDGLDECKNEADQRSIINLIANIIHSTPSFPVVWMICSRPEHHIKREFSEIVTKCWKEELPIDGKEVRDDVALYIYSSFADIRKTYSDMVDESWPSEKGLLDVIEDASGLFALASTIVRYVHDPEDHNPKDRLQSVIRHLRTSRSPDAENPMARLDRLYTDILSEVPRDILPTTLRIIHSILQFFKYGRFSSPTVVANFLGISRERFYRALRKLHSLLRIPPPQDASKKDIKVLHKSFGDYLSDPTRSGRSSSPGDRLRMTSFTAFFD